MGKSKKKVVVAMSGGVDSSLAAALLVRQGYDVIGVTMRLWAEAGAEQENIERSCCSLAAVEDARRVAARLGIPFYVLNFEEEFEKRVVRYFASEYERGRTPNPCIRCNKEIKFGLLSMRARELGADYIATGHYARIRYDENRGRYLLKRAEDRRKDQTYVLYGLSQEQLASTLMPLGDFTKDRTRRLAAELGFDWVARKSESQEICFIPDDDYRRFLETYSPGVARPGRIVDSSGKVLGIHRGIGFYTIGQRKGLGITASEPLYVIDIDAATNTLIVGTVREAFSEGLIATQVNWIAISELNAPLRAEVKIRYTAEPVWAIVSPYADLPADSGNRDSEGHHTHRIKVTFEEPQRSVTAGQSAVLYSGDVVLGGGIIEKRL
ncbi:MAG TPA: tRNA 2-thiouridine(34) synthase MnmA [Firmicutes bacterium]|nr:tRNA 2-thiouridine(34) synthase MnmA [Bacillota bacterium]